MSTPVHHPASYRDPSGFIFRAEGKIYRQVNQVYKEHYDLLMTSGLYKSLTEKGLLIPHTEIAENLTEDAQCYKTLAPELIPFISYPSEWSFGMLQDAALKTLQIQQIAMTHGMILKDATPYNLQWKDGQLIFIDTLSFEKYNETEPWIAYRQFCECFLAPLLLMHYSKQSLQAMFNAYPDGIPLQIASSLLPRRSRFSLHTYLHIHLHANVTGKSKGIGSKKASFNATKMRNLVSSLESVVGSLKSPTAQSTWSAYYDEASQRNDYLDQKKKIISDMLGSMKDIKNAADLGANDGAFSRLVAEQGIPVIAADFDPNCIQRLYTEIQQQQEQRIQPLIIDLANPTPATGLNNTERASFMQRLDTDLILALALIHHLCIGRNIPLEDAASFFHAMGSHLLIEFVPKEDEKVRFMLQQKADIYSQYDAPHFEAAFGARFTLLSKVPVPGSPRVLYLFSRKD